MTVKKVYVSEDGKEFNSEEECMDYEAKVGRRILTKTQCNGYNWMSLLQAKNGTYYIQIYEGDYRGGGCVFDGTFKQFVKNYFNR